MEKQVYMVDNIENFKEIAEKCRQEMKERYMLIFDSIPNSVLREYYFISKMLQNNYGYVYFLYNEDTKLTKIGYTTDLSKRFSQIKQLYQNYVGLNPSLKLIGVFYLSDFILSKFESQVHDLYKENRKYGEWFDLDIGVILNDWFLNGEYIQINNSFVCIEDAYEYEYFEKISKDYNFNDNEIIEYIENKYDIEIKTDIFKDFRFLKNNSNNKLLQIYNSCIKNNLSLECTKLCPENINEFNRATYRFGLLNKNFYSINSLKEETFKPKEVEKAINILHN